MLTFPAVSKGGEHGGQLYRGVAGRYQRRKHTLISVIYNPNVEDEFWEPSFKLGRPLVFQRGRNNNQQRPLFPIAARNSDRLNRLSEAHLIADDNATFVANREFDAADLER